VITSPSSNSLQSELKALYQRKAVVDQLIRKLEKYETMLGTRARKPVVRDGRKQSWAIRLVS
jgi:hypothetical protein